MSVSIHPHPAQGAAAAALGDTVQTDRAHGPRADRSDEIQRGHRGHHRGHDDVVALSPEALAFLKGDNSGPGRPDHDHSGHGRSGHSLAAQARAFLAEHPEFADRPFGQVVSGLIHGTLETAAADATPATDPLAPTDATEPAAGAIDAPPADEPAAGDTASPSGGTVTEEGAAVDAAEAGSPEPAAEPVALVPPVVDGESTVDVLLQALEDAAGEETPEPIGTPA